MKKEKEERLERGKHLLFIDVSDAFYYFQTYQEDLSIVEGMHKALFERVEELRRRQKLGRTRDSEVSSAEASLYKVEADAQEVRSQLEVARQLLEFLIGQPVVAIKDEILPNDLVVSLEEFLSKVDQRPDVQAAQRALEGAKKNIVVARAGYWPTVTLDANSYVKRVGVSTGNDWDLMLSLNVPLFNGTQTYGLIKTAQAQEKQAELTLSQVKRSAVLDIQNAYTKFTIDLKRELAIKKAADAAERNYQLQALDYRNSLVSHLDVLQALQAFEERLRDYIVIKNQVKRYYWNLKVAVGEVTRDVI
jgi:outer membrane protein TolC